MEMDDELRSMLTAYEGEVYGLTLQQLGEKYGNKSPATVARWQAKAKEKGYVQRKLVLNIPDEYKQSFLMHLTHRTIEERLIKTFREKYGSKLRGITVVPSELSGPDSERVGSTPATAAAVAFHTAGQLRHDIHVFRRDKNKTDINIGLNHGYLIHETCQCLKDTWADKDLQRTTVRLSALSGVHTVEPKWDPELARNAWRLSSTANCDALADAFHSNITIDRINMPAQLTDRGTRGFTEEERQLLSSYLMPADHAYRHLFGNRPVFATGKEVTEYRKRRKDPQEQECGHFLDLDIAVTGLSALEHTAGYRAYMSPELQQRVEQLAEEKLVSGEVAGHVFMPDGSIPRRDHSKYGNVMGTLNSLRVGLWPEDFMDLAQKKQDAEAGGVLMCCSGKQKAAPLFVVLTSGMELVNHAIIDMDIAEEFYKKLGLMECFTQDKEARDQVITHLG
jgi:hypothetical protein